MTYPSSPSGVRFGGGVVALGVALLCSLPTLVAAPAAAAPTPAPAGAGATPAEAAPSLGAVSPTPGAASTSYKLQQDEFSIMISPTRLVVSPKDVGTTQQISVINRGRAPVPVTVQKRNFVSGRDGSMRYVKESPYGADTWVTVSPTSFTVEPGSSQVVTADVSMPDDPDAGDHEVAVVFFVPSTPGKGNIKINRGLAAPMYITAPGATDDTVNLTGLDAPGFSTWGPVTLTATLQNQGTVHRDFRGATALHVEASGSPAVFGDFTVPRGATRDVATTWTPPLLCICHPRVSFANAGGVEQSLTVRVIVFPWPVAAVLLVLVGAAVLARRLRRRRRAVPRVVGARALVEDG